MLIQTLLNLLIYAMFVSVSFHSMLLLTKPIQINDLKHEYFQLQLDTLSSLYQGAEIHENRVCFSEDICIQQSHHRLILTPGHQILVEHIDGVHMKEQEAIEIHFKQNNIYRHWTIKKKAQR